MVFESKVIQPIKLKINGKIKKTIEDYHGKKVTMRKLLTDFLAVKSKQDELADALNPWAYLYKGINKYEIETGVSIEETLFNFSAMSLKEQKSSDVINAAFYANKKRNDSNFELGYVLPLFLENINQNDKILIVNPSPDIVCYIETSAHCGERYYAVTDSTVAALYQLQFTDAKFVPFNQMQTIKNIDAVLITNRDQKISQVEVLLKCLACCEENAKVIGFVPCTWLDNSKSGAYININKYGFTAKRILLVDSLVTSSVPRKKMILILEKGEADNIEIFESTYDEKTRQFSVTDQMIAINATSYMKSNKTILACVKVAKEFKKEKKTVKRNKAKEYRFSEEIGLFCRVYSNRNNKYAGIAYYKEIQDTELKTWGNRLSPYIEKGLRADSENKVIEALDDIIFDDVLYPIIRDDIAEKYISAKKTVTLKTIWFYCWNFLDDTKKYDHDYVSKLFKGSELADCMPQIQGGADIIEAVAKCLQINSDDIPYKTIEQIDLVIKTAVKHKILVYNPLEAYVMKYTQRATERQQNVRNALVKKHFLPKEERIIFKEIIRNKSENDQKVFNCTKKSLLLAGAIRLFTGMSMREVAALKWKDFRAVNIATDVYQFTITKFTDQKGKVVSNSSRENRKRFRIVPSAKVLSYLLNDRKQYLLKKGIDEDYLEECPIILHDEYLVDNMKKRKTINHCKPEKISAICNELIKCAKIQENEIVLPDSKNDLVTDLNRYHGDIFLSNFRHKANHSAFMTMGEINYMIGVNAPDTFSEHYCDYTNDFLQKGIVQKLCRWEAVYERMATGSRCRKPDFGVREGISTFEIGPFYEGVAAADLVVKNESSVDINLSVKSTYGININKTVY